VRGRGRLTAPAHAVRHRPCRQLRALGIDPVADLPGTGENLQDHPIVLACYATPAPLPRSRYNHGEVYAALRSPLAGACPSRRGWRKGTVEKANHSAAQRWWRTLPDEVTPGQAQARLDAWCAWAGDAHRPVRNGQRTMVGALAAAEPLMPPPPVQFPAVIEDARVVSAQALVAWHGNCYSVPPGHGGQRVMVRHRLSAMRLDVVTAAGTVLARHRREPDHAGAVVRDEGHVTALEKKVLAARGQAGRPHRRKERIPPSAAGLAEAAAIRGQSGPTGPVTDFAAWAAAARPLRPGDQG
jgi:hypothetical protein